MHPARAGGTLANSSPPPPNPSLKSTKQQKSSRSPCVPNFETSTHVRTRRKVLSSRLLKHTHTHTNTRAHTRAHARSIEIAGFDEERSRRRNEAITISARRIHPMPISANRGELEREAKRSSRVGDDGERSRSLLPCRFH